MRLEGAHALEAVTGGEFEGTLVGRLSHHQDRLVGQFVGGGTQHGCGGLEYRPRTPQLPHPSR